MSKKKYFRYPLLLIGKKDYSFFQIKECMTWNFSIDYMLLFFFSITFLYNIVNINSIQYMCMYVKRHQKWLINKDVNRYISGYVPINSIVGINEFFIQKTMKYLFSFFCVVLSKNQETVRYRLRLVYILLIEGWYWTLL